MVGGIQSLANMEYALYGNMAGGYGAYNAPSVVNGYCAVNPDYYNQYYNTYNYPSQDIFTKSQGKAADQWGGTYTKGTPITDSKDIDTIANYYYNNMSPSESFGGAITGGIGFAALQNPRVIAHPINTIRTSFDKELKTMFADATKDGKPLNTLWCDPKTNDLVREAYFRAHKVKARSYGKLGLFRKKFTEAEMTELNKVMKELEGALSSGNTEQIAKLTAKLDHAYVSNGWLPRTWKKILGKDVPTVESRLNDTAEINKKAANITKLGEKGSSSLWNFVKKSCTIKSGLGWAAFEALFDAKDIASAFKESTGTGLAQLGQTAVKGAGSAVGWMAGEAIGTWAATKALAVAGTAIAPGIGTAIGAVAGFVVGSVGMWLTGKLTKRIVGKNVGAKADIKEMKKTPEGHAQLLSLTAPIAEQDKNLDPNVRRAFENIAARYSVGNQYAGAA